MLIKTKAQLGLNVIVLGGTEAHLVAKELAAAQIPVILNPLQNLPSQFEDLSATLANAARLHAAGVVIGFYDPPSGTHNLRLLPQLAGNAVANGLPYAAALAALTINPARMYGAADRYGSIEIGKAGDLVLWDGDPLEVSSRPVAVYIDGRATSLVTRQTRLRDRYRDLSRGDLPHAYRGAQ
jgi:imidazolonepropionase-like amidohydrolase